MRLRPWLGSPLLVLMTNGCGGGAAAVPDAAPQPTEQCDSVRYTWYTAARGGWCEFDRTAPMLPASVRAGLTLAIAKPWAGSSYGGAFGEACGECWEIASLTETRVIMVHDLCPIEGNPVCNGSHFHVDLSGESKDALAVDGIGAASARRVPCPVTGNVHLQILDRNEWGYLRFQVINHRMPIRTVELRAANGATYYPAERSGGAWHVLSNGAMLEADGEGAVFRFTSARGEVLETPNTLTYARGAGEFFDTGGQLDEPAAAGATCAFTPPPDLYADGYGGIERVRWTMNPWGSARPSETDDGCHTGTCLRITGLTSGSGFHIHYPAAFASTTFRRLHLWGRTESGSGTLVVKLQGEHYTCAETSMALTSAWAGFAIDLGTTCAGQGLISMFTAVAGTAQTVRLDDVRLER